MYNVHIVVCKYPVGRYTGASGYRPGEWVTSGLRIHTRGI